MTKTRSNARSLAFCREQLGWPVAEIVEKFNPHAGEFGKRSDLFGFADILGMTGGRIVAVQACGSDLAAHRRKLEVTVNVYEWLNSGGHVELQAWRKLLVKRGGKKRMWNCRRIAVTSNGDGLTFKDINQAGAG